MPPPASPIVSKRSGQFFSSTSTRAASLDSLASAQLWSNPFVTPALQILDQLTDVARVLPFVAPVFVLLKIVIDIEKRATETDAKCTDLLERIVFMTSHLPALESVKSLPDATMHVIDKMNDAMKAAVTLIQSYRKQSQVARRLNLGNRDKFNACADAINTCCNELLMSLQIYQSTQLDILTRSIPLDAEDEAAEEFIADHGGADAVKGDESLVSEFATRYHLTMDDSVMEQINENVAFHIQANQARLESALGENISTAVVEGLKALASQISQTEHDLEREHLHTCVQCTSQFRASRTTPTSCSFHRTPFDTWTKRYGCCGSAGTDSQGCQSGPHRSKHHCDYPYATFFPRAWAILNYIDTRTIWTSIEDTNLESDKSVSASVSQLLRWVSRGDRLAEPSIIITVNAPTYKEPYFFEIYTARTLADAAESARRDESLLIFRSADKEGREYAMAEWVLGKRSGAIVGVKISVKAATSDRPYSRLCPIDASLCTKGSGDVLTISEGGFHSYTPATPYSLPPTVKFGAELREAPPRVARTDFKTRTTDALPVILKATSDPPLTANPQFASTKDDTFIGSFTVLNKSAEKSGQSITFTGGTASFRYVGESSYTPCLSTTSLGVTFPITIAPRESFVVRFEARVGRTPEDAALGVKWWNRAFCARHKPIRIKVELEDLEGEKCALVFEYVYTPYAFEKRKEEDVAMFSIDSIPLYERYNVHVARPSSSSEWSKDSPVISIKGTDISVRRLEKIAYLATSSSRGSGGKETEIDLELGGNNTGSGWTWKAYALVDTGCRRVYAFKIIMLEEVTKEESEKGKKPAMGCLGYVLCPDYAPPRTGTSSTSHSATATAASGSAPPVSEVHSISYAKEKIFLPPIEPVPLPDVVWDDTVDDELPPPPPPAPKSQPAAETNGSASVAVGAGLEARLASVDRNLDRLATALEKLVDILAKK